MKRFIALLLLFLTAISLAACASTGGDTGGAGGAGGAPARGGNGGQPAALTGEISGEITVSCFDTMSQKAFLDEAAQLFEEKYPGTKVNIDTFSAMPEVKSGEQGNMRMTAVQMEDDPQARADYITKVNTALMSGSGADIYAVDILPIYKLADSGNLVDLDAVMSADPDFNRSDYRGNILDALFYKGKLWCVPLEYSFDYFTYDSTLVNSDAANFGVNSAYNTKQLMDIAMSMYNGSEKVFNMTGWSKGGSGGGGGGIYSRMLNEYYSTFVDIENREAHFIDGGFAQLLEQVKAYEQSGYINESISNLMDAASSLMQGGVVQASERFYFKSKNNMALQQQFTRNLGRQMNVMMMAAGNALGIEDDDEIAGIQADAKGKSPFRFEHGYAMNAAGKNQQTAWAFLKFLLSEERQLSGGLSAMALPLHNGARSEKLELLMSGAFVGRGMGMAQPGKSGQQPGGQGQQPGGQGQQPGGQGQQPGGQVQQPDGQGQQPGGQGQQPGGQGQQPDGQGQQPDGQVQQPGGQVQQPGGQVQQPGGQGQQPGGQGQPGMQIQPGQPIELDETQLEALAKYREAIEQLSAQINTITIRDSVIDDMIAVEAQYFFEGVKSAEEATATLQSKVDLYLNE